MKVERLKYVILAADSDRADSFFTRVFDGAVLKRNEVISEVAICGGVTGIHSGGEGKRTRGRALAGRRRRPDSPQDYAAEGSGE